ncbi:MAG: glycosyltransferase family 39 protein [Acidobacteria bacterium]|nr:glycosyltransferase family 39 protein [Acidobacteriota bacterium]
MAGFFNDLNEKSKSTALILLFGIFIYFISIFWAPALLDDADSVHAQAAQEMVANNNFITLYANGIRYLEKAPFMYWLIAISYKLFGLYDPVGRIPIALASIALMLVTASFGRWAFGERAGLYSGIITGTCVGIYLFTRILIPDVILALWLTLALYSFLRALDKIEKRENPQNWLIGLYSSAALAVLTKGLIGMVFPGAIIALFLLLTKRLYLIPKFWLIRGTLLFLIIAAPWHILAGLTNFNPEIGKGFFWFYFVNEHFLRYLGKRYPIDYDKVPIVVFYLLHFLWLFPWSVFAPLYKFSSNFLRQHSESRSREINLLLIIWPLIIILFFSFSTRQEYYTLPALPAFALLIGKALSNSELSNKDSSLNLWLNRLRFSLFIFGILVSIVAAIILYLIQGITPNSDIATMLGRNPEYYALSLGHIFDLRTESFTLLESPLIGAALSFLIGGGACYFLGRKGKDLAANLALALAMSSFFICAQMAMWVFEPYLSSKEIAKVIKQTYKSGDLIIINGEYESGSSINFYTKEPVIMLNNRTANLEFGSKFPDAPKRFIDDREFLKYWDSGQKIYVVTLHEATPALNKLLGERKIYEIMNLGGKYLYSNQAVK